MRANIRSYSILSTALMAAILLASSMSFGLAEEPKPGSITVSATGSATVAPDMAILNLTVQREGKTARDALDANNSAMAGVLASMKEAGIEDRDLQTSNFNIQPRYFYPKRRKDGQQKPPQITGYIVYYSLTVRIRKLADVGAILDKSVSLGVNSGGHISFTTDKPGPIIEMARKNAMSKAIAKANTLTESAGVRLGRIMEISEQNFRQPRSQPLARAKASFAEDAAVPIASGENTYSVTVNVRWELAQ